MPEPPACATALLADCVAFDLEVDARGRISALGAVRGEQELRIDQPAVAAELARLDAFAAGASLLVGHNLLWHDLGYVAAAAPGLELLRMPVVDTLLLSPLAFPKRPYHSLVKDYQLERAVPNDPVADARLALRVLSDAVAKLLEVEPVVRSLCAWAFHAAAAADQGLAAVAETQPVYGGHRPGRDRRPARSRARDHGGHAALFAALGAVPPADPGAAFATLHSDRVCSTAVRASFAAQAAREPLALAFVTTWLATDDPGSVLPAWVRRSFPDVVDLVQRLRAVDCAAPGCTWCRDEHRPEAQLERFFGFASFRAEPRAQDGSSLQRAIVADGMRGGSQLAILPTGAGKSLCFQVPALVRHRRSGQLTVVISPLQALMKDQVDGLARRSAFGSAAAALNGQLTPLERADVLDRVRLGEVGILYVSPEQLRSVTFRRLVDQREIGAWVFDEAHCLSKWGHDFRPDYLYAARFIGETARRSGTPVPPITCLTATAKADVQDEILAHFRDQLGVGLQVFAGGVERRNLEFVVEHCPEAQRFGRIAELCAEVLEQRGSVIVYCNTRPATDDLAAFLIGQQLDALAYHAGLDPPERRERQDRFLGDEVRVVCATNAFGMGIDKPDVRLVLHAQMPASLENYLQEAGRAGRDQQPARCVLLYAEGDPERQFSLLARSRLSHEDLQQLLAALRRLRRRWRQDDQPLVVTAGELLRSGDVDLSFDPTERDAPTRVATAVAWLERDGFVQRDENQVGLIAARPTVRSEAEFAALCTKAGVQGQRAAMWRDLWRALAQARPDQGLGTDELAGLPSFRTWANAQPPQQNGSVAAGREVLRVLHEMARAGAISDSLRLTAFIRDRVKDPSTKLLEEVDRLERAMLDALRSESPDADRAEGWLPLWLPELNERLRANAVDSDPQRLQRLLRAWSRDGRGFAGQQGSVDLRPASRDTWSLRFRRSWEELTVTAARRRQVAGVILAAIVARVPAGAPPRKDQFVEFTLEDLRRAVDADLLLRAELKDPLAAIERALLFLDELGVIVLQRGLTVFRSAMTLTLPRDDQRRYAKQHYDGLRAHYGQQVQGVHVIARYAEQGARDLRAAQRLVLDYFTLDRASFLRRHFPAEREVIGRETSPQSYARIVDALGDAAQQAVVTADPDRNLLVLAGPGSGKTRVVVHRCAWLLRVQRVPPAAILMICFNRATAVELRRRLNALVGADANGVLVTTYHGAAARLCGRSVAGRATAATIDFDAVLDEAVALLRGETLLPGLEPDVQRERLLGGFRHILVDEYQDIDERQYALIAALAGRGLPADEDRPRVGLCAVGDDDQAIYGFRGASAEFLHRFREEYAAEQCELLDNYRATPAIVAATNAVIAGGAQRLKTTAIRVDARRRDGPPGAPVEIMAVQGSGLLPAEAQAVVATDQLAAWRAAGLRWSDLAVLARERETLAPLRALCEVRGLPVRWAADGAGVVWPWRIREVAAWLDALHQHGQRPDTRGSARPVDLRALAQTCAAVGQQDSPWWSYVGDLIAGWVVELGGDAAADAAAPVAQILDFLWDLMREDRRQRAVREGIEFRTMHGAKGLEFAAVLVLDGGFGAGRESLDEQRRLFYVATTRARQRLCIVSARGDRNPFLGPMRAAGAEERPVEARADAALRATMALRYESLALDDLYVDFAAQHGSDSELHRWLAALRVGAALSLGDGSPRLRILDGAGRRVGELSNKGSQIWRPRLAQIEQVTVRAVLRRERSHVDADYAECCRVERWELPLPEVAWRPRVDRSS